MPLFRAFLTGKPGCGKTSVVQEITRLLIAKGVKPGGLISKEILRGGIRVGFSLQDLATKEQGSLAHVDQMEGPHVGKYRVNLTDIERIGVASIHRAVSNADVIIVDELGPMELHSPPFVSAVEIALKSPKPFVGTIHARASHPLVSSIRSNPLHEIAEVTEQNRDQLANRICERLMVRL